MAQINTQYLAIMQMDSIDLLARRQEETPSGRLIRKEITRREKCGYWKGEFPVHKGGKDGTMQTPSRVGTVTTYIKGAK
tara:strand:- start:1983 stop:2219 length:237 start_codon:yes stop_codon:yes gene_type:complete